VGGLAARANKPALHAMLEKLVEFMNEDPDFDMTEVA
jgi:hypothetical protein